MCERIRKKRDKELIERERRIKRENKIESLEQEFSILKERIIQHRNMCFFWKKGDSCFDCHKNNLGRIEKAIDELKLGVIE